MADDARGGGVRKLGGRSVDDGGEGGFLRWRWNGEVGWGFMVWGRGVMDGRTERMGGVRWTGSELYWWSAINRMII